MPYTRVYVDMCAEAHLCIFAYVKSCIYVYASLHMPWPVRRVLRGGGEAGGDFHADYGETIERERKLQEISLYLVQKGTILEYGRTRESKQYDISH